MSNINWSEQLDTKDTWSRIDNRESTTAYFITGYKNNESCEITVWEGEEVSLEDGKFGKKLDVKKSEVTDGYDYLVEWNKSDGNYKFLARKQKDCVHIVRSIMKKGTLGSVIRGKLVSIN